MKTVSCFISNRNHGKYVRAAVDSVMSQTVPPTEVILINDGSQDKTAEVFERCAAMYPEVRVITHQTPQGHINGYNEGILRSHGDYLHLMSADDVLNDSTFYERGIKALETACLFSGGLQWMDSEGMLMPQKAIPPFNGEVSAELCLRAMNQFGNFICGAATLVRGDLQRKHLYDGSYPFTADAINWARILCHNIPAAFTTDVVFLYRRHQAQMTSHSSGPEEERKRMREELEACSRYASHVKRSLPQRGSSS